MYDLPQVTLLIKGRGCPDPRPQTGVSRAAGSPSPALSLAGIAEILMNRPSARNALGNVFVSQVSKGGHQGGLGRAGRYLIWSPLQLLEALAQLREDRQVRVLIFRSAVKGVFCAGGFPSLPPTRGSAGLPPACM